MTELVIGKHVLKRLEKLLSEGYTFNYHSDLVDQAKKFGYPGPATLIALEYWFYGSSSRDIAGMLKVTRQPILRFLWAKADQFDYALMVRGRGGDTTKGKGMQLLRPDDSGKLSVLKQKVKSFEKDRRLSLLEDIVVIGEKLMLQFKCKKGG